MKIENKLYWMGGFIEFGVPFENGKFQWNRKLEKNVYMSKM